MGSKRNQLTLQAQTLIQGTLPPPSNAMQPLSHSASHRARTVALSGPPKGPVVQAWGTGWASRGLCGSVSVVCGVWKLGVGEGRGKYMFRAEAPAARRMVDRRRIGLWKCIFSVKFDWMGLAWKVCGCMYRRDCRRF